MIRGEKHPKQQKVKSTYNQYNLKKYLNYLFKFANGVNSKNNRAFSRALITNVKWRSIFFKNKKRFSLCVIKVHYKVKNWAIV